MKRSGRRGLDDVGHMNIGRHRIPGRGNTNVKAVECVHMWSIREMASKTEWPGKTE